MTLRSERISRPVLAQYVQLLVGCAVLGVGVALMLEAALGSDGYSTLVNGLTLASGLAFWQLNMVVGAVFVGLAWARGTRPGPGTLVQWFFVGFVISGVMAAIPEVTSMPRARRHARRRPRPHRGRRRGVPGQRHRRRPGGGDGTRLGPADPVPLELQPRPVRWCPGRVAARRGRRRRARSWSSCCSVRPSTSSGVPSPPWSGRPTARAADPPGPTGVRPESDPSPTRPGWHHGASGGRKALGRRSPCVGRWR